MVDIKQNILKNYMNISDNDVAFGTTKLLPKPAEVPEDMSFLSDSKWNNLFKDLFFCGLSELSITPKEGIDTDMALKCIKAHMSSWEPKHEEKEAGVAYMMSILFEDASWTIQKD
jgi:hypothetical protein